MGFLCYNQFKDYKVYFFQPPSLSDVITQNPLEHYAARKIVHSLYNLAHFYNTVDNAVL